MEPFIRHTGTAAPLRRSNVDTDQIIPAEYLKRITRDGFEDGLFSAWRKDPDFVLNRDEYQGVSILVAGPDFGTGSSREHAVWALQNYGFCVVLSSRFADIFRGNSGKGGLLTAQVDQSVIEELWTLIEADPSLEVTVDLDARTVRAGDLTADFEVDDYVRWRLMEGLDDIGITMQHADAIAEFEAHRPRRSARRLHQSGTGSSVGAAPCSYTRVVAGPRPIRCASHRSTSVSTSRRARVHRKASPLVAVTPSSMAPLAR